MISGNPVSVAVIGGGFCGIMTLVNLLQKSAIPLAITLINKGCPVARGVAYSTYSNRHLLNVPARNMSAFPDQPDHFVEWCLTQDDISLERGEVENSFMPRNVYGRYLESIYNSVISDSSTIHSVTVINDEAIDIDKGDKNYLIKTGSGKVISAEKIVLATGNCAPAPPALIDSDYDTEKYYSNPWTENAVAGLKDTDTVLIIGTGLTMVDVVIGLLEKNFRGNILALSPHGFKILSHRNSRPQRYILDELSPPYTLENLFRLFYKHIRQARTRGQSGETVVDAIRAKTQEIWQQLSLRDKKKFMTHLRHLWGVARHRLPAQVHSQIRRLIREKRLEVIAGRIRNIKHTAEGFSVTIQKRNQSMQELSVARMINCTGPQTDISRQKSRLYDNLLSKGLVRADEMNLGIDAHPDGCVINAEGNIPGDMYAIGSLLKGILWESTAIPELRTQAARVAELIGQVSTNKVS